MLRFVPKTLFIAFGISRTRLPSLDWRTLDHPLSSFPQSATALPWLWARIASSHHGLVGRSAFFSVIWAFFASCSGYYRQALYGTVSCTSKCLSSPYLPSPCPFGFRPTKQFVDLKHLSQSLTTSPYRTAAGTPEAEKVVPQVHPSVAARSQAGAQTPAVELPVEGSWRVEEERC